MSISGSRPKGISGRKDGSTDKEEHLETNPQGSKRIRTKEVDEIKLEKDQENQTRPGKKRRELSPEGGQIKWRLRPTFLDLKMRKGCLCPVNRVKMIGVTVL